MATINQEALLGNLREIGQRAQVLCGRYFEQSEIVGIDYTSVFTTEGAEYEELCETAATLSDNIYTKRGEIYRIRDKDIAGSLPSAIIRVSEPADIQLLGCTDMIPVNFESARTKLLDIGYEEKSKWLNGQDYTIIEIADHELGVSIYLPSKRMTVVMGIA